MGSMTQTESEPIAGPILAKPIAAQGVRFIASGGFVAVVYIATTSLLAALGVEFEAALAIGFCMALSTHFTLQRLFVWKDATGFALPLRQQLVRYLLLACTQYGITAAATATLPRALGVQTEIVYLSVAAALTTTNFLVFRVTVFHSASGADPRSRGAKR